MHVGPWLPRSWTTTLSRTNGQSWQSDSSHLPALSTVSFNRPGYNAYNDGNCAKAGHVIKLTLAINYHAKNETFFQEPSVRCLLCTWQLIFSFLCRSGQSPLTPLCPTGTHQSSVSVSFEQLVALIDYGMEFWHRIRQGAGKAMLGALARITFSPRLRSRWLTKCCVVTLMNTCVSMLCFVRPTIQSIVRSKIWNVMNGGISATTGLRRKRLRLWGSSKTLSRPWWDKNASAPTARPLANAISIIMIVAIHRWLGKFHEAHFE